MAEDTKGESKDLKAAGTQPGLSFNTLPDERKKGKVTKKEPQELAEGYAKQPEGKGITAIKFLLRYYENPREIQKRRAPERVYTAEIAEETERMRSGAPAPDPDNVREIGDVWGGILPDIKNGGYMRAIIYDGTRVLSPAPDIKNEEERRAAILEKSGGRDKHFFEEKLLDFLLRKIRQAIDNKKFENKIEFDLTELAECFDEEPKNAGPRFMDGTEFLSKIAIDGYIKETVGNKDKLYSLIRGGKTPKGEPAPAQEETEIIYSLDEETAQQIAKSTTGPHPLCDPGTLEGGKCVVGVDASITWEVLVRHVMPVPRFVYALKQNNYAPALWIFQQVRQNIKTPEYTANHEVRIRLFKFYEIMELPALDAPEIALNRKGDEKIKQPIKRTIESIREKAAKDNDISLRYEFRGPDGETITEEEGDAKAMEKAQKQEVRKWLFSGFLIVTVNPGKYREELEKYAQRPRTLHAPREARIAEFTRESRGENT